MRNHPPHPQPLSPPAKGEGSGGLDQRFTVWGMVIGSVLAFAVVWPHTLFLISAGIEAYLGLALVYAVIQTSIKKQKLPHLPWPLALAFLFVLALAFQVPRAADLGYGWHELEKKLCWIALPAACWLRPPNRREVEGIAYHFVWFVLLLLPLSYVFALKRYIMYPLAAHYIFDGTSLLYPFDMHRVFLAMEAMVALLICVRFGPRFFGRWWLAPAALLLFWHITLASRTGLISTGLLIVLAFGWLLFKKRYRPAALIGMVGIGGLILVLSRPTTLSKLRDLRPTRSLPTAANVNMDDSYATRYYIWKGAWALIKEDPIFGIGTGNVEPALAAQYEKEGYDLGVKYRFNAHNQYLQTWLDSGLPGLLLLFAMLLTPAILGLRRRDWLGPAFTLVWAAALTTESMNEVSRCAVVFALFYGMYGTGRKRPATEGDFERLF